MSTKQQSIYCPECYAAKVYSGRNWLFLVMGLVTAISAFLSILLGCSGTITNWELYCPDPSPAAFVVTAFGLLMAYAGVKDWNKLICEQCGHKWEPRSAKLRSRLPIKK